VSTGRVHGPYTGVTKLTPVFTGPAAYTDDQHGPWTRVSFIDTLTVHGSHFGHSCSRDTARKHGPWTRVVCTELCFLLPFVYVNPVSLSLGKLGSRGRLVLNWSACVSRWVRAEGNVERNCSAEVSIGRKRVSLQCSDVIGIGAVSGGPAAAAPTAAATTPGVMDFPGLPDQFSLWKLQ